MSELKSQRLSFSSKFLIISGILGVAGLVGVYLYQRFRTPALSLTRKSLVLSNSDDQEQNPEKTFVRVINSLRKQINEKSKLTSQTIKAIFRSQFQLSKRQFRILTTKNRAERRRILGDIKQYHELVSAYEEDLVELHNKYLDGVLAHFKFDKNEWIEAVHELSVSEVEEWDAFLLETESQQFESLRRKEKPKISSQFLQAIAKFKISKIKQSTSMFMQISDIQKSDLYSLIEKWIQDSVFMIFKAEIEDINFSTQQLDQTQQKSIEEYQNQYCDLVQALVFEDSVVFSEN